jgi:hypothetical protein
VKNCVQVKGKNFGLKERNIHSGIGSICFGVITPEAFFMQTIPQKQALNGTWFQFCTLVLVEVDKNKTPEDFRRKHQY